MPKDPTWRIISDYIGAGAFFMGPDQAVVGTDYGLQSVPLKLPGGVSKNGEAWKLELGSRSIGVYEQPDGALLATCPSGLFLVSRDGNLLKEKLFSEDLVHIPVEFDGGMLVTSSRTLQFFPSWDQAAWSYDLREALGQSVESIRLINLFGIDGHIVLGAVDYDRGIGRVVVLDGRGEARWMSPPGPLSDLFPAGKAVFVWSLTGYGKFESHLTRLDGHEIWVQNFAGIGAKLPEGSFAMLVGSNESPEWDHWEYRRISANGKAEVTLQAKGRSAARPLCLEDGTVYFVGSVLYLDPTSSRVDYTNFLAMPQQVLFEHLFGIRDQIPEYDVALHRVRRRGEKLEILYDVSGSFSLAEPRIFNEYVVLCDGPDIIGVKT